MHAFAQQSLQPGGVILARNLEHHVALVIHDVSGDVIQLPTHLPNIGGFQRHNGTFSGWVDQLRRWACLGSLERRFGLVQFILACLGNGAIDATG
ncbi:hypothetical protein D3C78_1712170 [compost metagenome]